MAENTKIPSLSLKEKFGYSLGDFASNLFWMTFIFYGMFFYTDVFGLPAASVGFMFLITKFWDSVNDPIMGILSDRTNTKYGKYRPYLLWMLVPYGVFGFFAFYTPDITVTGKLIYAYITYTLMMMVYTAINIPYSALMGVLTPSSKDRTSIATYRFAAAFAGGIAVQAIALPMVANVGGDNEEVFTATLQENHQIHIKENGTGTIQLKARFIADNPEPGDWQKKLMNDFAGVFSDQTYMEETTNIWVNTPARLAEIQPEDEENTDGDVTRVGKNYYLPIGFGEKTIKLKDLFYNADDYKEGIAPKRRIDWSKQVVSINPVDTQMGFEITIGMFALISMALWLVTFFSTKERVTPPTSENTHVLKDIKDVVTNVPWLLVGVMGLFTLAQVCIRGGAIMYYFKYFVKDMTPAPAFMLAGTIMNLVGTLVTDWLTKKIGGKKRVYMIFSFLTVLTMIPFMWLKADNLLVMFILTAIGGFLSGPLSPIVWAMYADIADYSEWKKGTRATGLFFSAATFAQKMGWTIGGALAGVLLAAYGFKANIEQSAEAITGIKALMSWIPAIGCAVAGAVVIFYKLDDSFMEKVVEELQERRDKQEAAASDAASDAEAPA